MTLQIVYPEIKDIFASNQITITNKSPSTIKILKITPNNSILFNFKLSSNNSEFTPSLYLTSELQPNNSITVYLKADTRVVDRVISDNYVSIEVEYV